ncbi:MAG: DUF58 domain-containing protein [Leptolyngbyaceae cyanobacterium]
MFQGLWTWLETRWVAPAYAGGVLLGVAIAFFGAAVNSMAGWLYAISGVMSAIALINIWASPRSLRGVQVQRQPICPVSVGELLMVDLEVENTTPRAKVLLQILDQLPAALGQPAELSISTLSAHQHQRWRHTCHPTRRGIYTWETVSLRTAAPFGLFWCQRQRPAPAHATIYPQILPLPQCPLIDHLGVALGGRWQSSRQAQQASQGLTRAVRPYRWGDPTRLIHWRTSARYGELRVRELEEQTADNQVIIGLDTRDRWTPAAFESAVIGAASLYIYSLQRQLSVALWLPDTGLLDHKHAVLSALAEVMPDRPQTQRLPAQPLIWLGAAPPSTLPDGSLWVQWREATRAQPDSRLKPTLTIDPEQDLAEQMNAELR